MGSFGKIGMISSLPISAGDETTLVFLKPNKYSDNKMGGVTYSSVGKDNKTETYYLIIDELLIPTEKVGVDLKDKHLPSTNKTRIYVKNLEGLAVLEDMVKNIKEKLRHQVVNNK